MMIFLYTLRVAPDEDHEGSSRPPTTDQQRDEVDPQQQHDEGSAIPVDLSDPRAFLRPATQLAPCGIVYKCLLFVVLCFLLNLAANPVKELFVASPWIQAYDPLYLVTAQGVFGFINKIRPQVVMEYSHTGSEFCASSPFYLSPHHTKRVKFTSSLRIVMGGGVRVSRSRLWGVV